ncbi:MAG TPA: hypothetical protein VH087_03670 [Thermoanaerobaculia bacterium]|nr:hypothetical protein [Thermoanaerobaculia bacterium]
MSYLDTPRLHFSGTFTADPSTINNNPSNYPDLTSTTNPPSSQNVIMSWNPYGSHAWTINAQVTSFVDTSGTTHINGDPLIGASIASYMPGNVPAKLVDLDTEQQGVTRLFGLNLQIVLSGSSQPSMQGLWMNAGTLVNLWLNRVPSMAGTDTGAGGAFQSVLQSIQWSGGSPFLNQLQTAAANGLSVRLSVFGYDGNSASPTFQSGVVLGTIGPQLANEPLHIPPRLLRPVTQAYGMASPMAWAPAKVTSPSQASGQTFLTIDLGNSIQDSQPGGPPVSGLTMEAAVLQGGTPVSLGAIDYETAFAQTASVVQFPITAAQAGMPLAILLNGQKQLFEPDNGEYVDFDGASVYMNPNEQATVNLWATAFGSPKNAAVNLALAAPAGAVGFDNNAPAAALTFPSNVNTGNGGVAPVTFTSTDPVPLPSTRMPIGGQVYFVGGSSWPAGNNWNGGSSSSGAPIFYPTPFSVKLFTSLPTVPNPTWSDVQPILYKYYYLYGYMASIVDLSDYGSVKGMAQAIQSMLTLSVDDPSYMPVTREMSNDETQLVLTWIANGCPAT